MTSALHIPEATVDGWSIERRVVSDEDAEKDEVVAVVMGDPKPTVQAGVHTVLCRDGVVWMSDSAPELADHDEVLAQVARRGGRVLVHGLGLGLILRQMLALENVEHVDVVELEPAIIALVGPSLQDTVNDGRLTIHQGDCRVLAWPAGTRWSVVWHDIWPDIGRETRAEAAMLEQQFAGRCDWQASWGGSD